MSLQGRYRAIGFGEHSTQAQGRSFHCASFGVGVRRVKTETFLLGPSATCGEIWEVGVYACVPRGIATVIHAVLLGSQMAAEAPAMLCAEECAVLVHR